MNTTEIGTPVTFVTGQRLRIVDGPLCGRTATVIRHDPDPRALYPVEARTGRVGTVVNAFAVNEVSAMRHDWTGSDLARACAEFELEVARDLVDFAAYQSESIDSEERN